MRRGCVPTSHSSSRTPSGTDIYKLCACCVVSESSYVHQPCLHRGHFFLMYSIHSVPYNLLHLLQTSLSLEGRTLMEMSHLELSDPRSNTLCMFGFWMSISSLLLQEERFLMMIEESTTYIRISLEIILLLMEVQFAKVLSHSIHSQFV